MKPLKRLAGLIMLMCWAATLGLVGVLFWMPLYIISPQAAERWVNWVGATGNLPADWFTDGTETLG